MTTTEKRMYYISDRLIYNVPTFMIGYGLHSVKLGAFRGLICYAFIISFSYLSLDKKIFGGNFWHQIPILMFVIG